MASSKKGVKRVELDDFEFDEVLYKIDKKVFDQHPYKIFLPDGRIISGHQWEINFPFKAIADSIEQAETMPKDDLEASTMGGFIAVKA